MKIIGHRASCWTAHRGEHGVEVSAVVPTPGLVVHRVLIPSGDGYVREGAAWVVAHAASGKLIAPPAVTFRTRRAACDAATFIASLGLFDWERPIEELRTADETRVNRVKNALADLSIHEDDPTMIAKLKRFIQRYVRDEAQKSEARHER